MARPVVKVISTVEAVASMLEEDIYSLHFTMGEKLPEADLVSRYNVSRNTLRESVTYLVSKGLLEKVNNRGFYVKEILADDVAEIFHLRELLEVEAIRQIINSGSMPSKLWDLAGEVSMNKLEVDRIANMKADIAFHTGIVEAAGSPRLMKMYEDLLYELKLCIYQAQAFVPARPENIVTHYRLLQSMEKGDLVKSLAYLKEHIASAVEIYQKELPNRKAKS